jgi:demethylmenaquinone methyltransferase/2-methoxy-6-polyprenyl-1,4-benzoquinol methylase
MPFRASFDCLWCGSTHTCRGPDDLEGWASICPACAGKAGENGFIRYRIRRGLAERGAARRPAVDREMLAYYEARAPEYDDWYLRRGRYSHGPEEDAAWSADLGRAREWLAVLPWRGEILEIAAGTGWWSPVLAAKGRLTMIDGAEAPLRIARERLAALGLTAETLVRDAWARPDRTFDGLFAGFWLSHVPQERLAAFFALARAWLRPGGTFAFIDSVLDPASGATDNPRPADGASIRRLADGREFRIVKEFYAAERLEDELARAGFAAPEVTTSGRFFVLGAATAGP